MLLPTQSTKLFKLTGPDSAIVISPKPSGGYVLMNVIRNVVTTTNSAGGRGELWRVGKVLDVEQVVVSVGGQRWPLAGAPTDTPLDALTYQDRRRDYVRNNGAADYAFIDADLKQYAGSYHGGEVSLSVEWRREGEVFRPELGAVVLGTAFEVRQTTCVLDKLLIESAHLFRADGAAEFSASLSGKMNVSTAYTAMNTASDSFGLVTFPQWSDLSGLPNGAEVKLGRVPKVVQENAETGQKITTHLTLQDDDAANARGVFVRKAHGAYNKLYYGVAVGSPYTVRDLAWSQARVFD